jgi:extracellular factor (EF) 3-hydroxypalmitic acid methyl ester biosynthesis protein
MGMDVDKLKENKRDNPSLGLSAIQTTLRNRIKLYLRRAREIEEYLQIHPNEWGKFQNEFNSEINAIFRDIMDFEKINIATGNVDKVEKLKRLFVNRIRKIFMRGVYIEWSLKKPYGYPGDFKIIDDIYRNNPDTNGFDRLFDNYYQMSAICVAVRNRKEDFKRTINNFISERKQKSIRIMNLACGSARDIKEIVSSNPSPASEKQVIFDCYDHDQHTIDFASVVLGRYKNVNLIKKNAFRIAATKNVESKQIVKYDFIYATGLFDYLTHKVSAKLIRNLRKLLNKDGILAISNVRDKYSNPSVHFMEWVGDWNLFYRTDDEFKKVFLDGGFRNDELEVKYEQQGIMQYIFAHNKKR